MTDSLPPRLSSGGGMGTICDDLTAETADLVGLLAPLAPPDWVRTTPAEGWTIADTVAHLTYFDTTAILAATDPGAFKTHVGDLLAMPDPQIAVRQLAGERRGPELLTWFNAERARLTDTLGDLDPHARIPWYGPPMAATSFATARLMETWAHGQDVADTIGQQRPPTARLRHVAHIGVRARPFSFVTNGQPAPEGLSQVILEPPDGGEPWVWNPEAGDDVVSGPALDFCLVVTQRRHLDDTRLVVRGDRAHAWMKIAQAFAGGPGRGRHPGQFPPL